MAEKPDVIAACAPGWQGNFDMGFISWLLDLLFPPKCPFCGRILGDGADPICADCRQILPRTREGESFKVDFMTKVVSPLYYEKQVRESFLRYKFHGVSSYSTVYAQLMAETIARELDNGYDLITWVPLSRKRLRKRGYDQARLLAEKVAFLLTKDVKPVLKKDRDTKAQSSLLTAQERRGNVSGCYSLMDSAAIQGKRILLIDDILTTGSTLSECARVLLLGGADAVCGATFARKRI